MSSELLPLQLATHAGYPAWEQLCTAYKRFHMYASMYVSDTSPNHTHPQLLECLEKADERFSQLMCTEYTNVVMHAAVACLRCARQPTPQTVWALLLIASKEERIAVSRHLTTELIRVVATTTTQARADEDGGSHPMQDLVHIHGKHFAAVFNNRALEHVRSPFALLMVAASQLREARQNMMYVLDYAMGRMLSVHLDTAEPEP